jgi:hypothetical protein
MSGKQPISSGLFEKLPSDELEDTAYCAPTIPAHTEPSDKLSKVAEALRGPKQRLSVDEIPDLWPDDIAKTDPSIVTPVVILREQAERLTEKSKGLIEGRVIRERLGVANKIWLSFYLIAPVLDNYRCHLFRVEHGMGCYPVRLAPSVDLPDHDNTKYLIIHDEEEFLETLREIFSAQKTRRLIRTLVAQSKALAED